MIFGHKQLIRKLENSATIAGWQLTYQERTDEYVSRLIFSRGEESEDVLAHLWNLESYHETDLAFHVQTDAGIPIQRLEGVKTLLLGYWLQNNVFAGWDAGRHSGLVTGFSPSFQIREEYLLKAHADGLAVCPHGNDEVAVAFNPDLFINYITNLYELHGATSPEEQTVVTQIVEADGQVNEATIASLPLQRQVVFRKIAERQRATNFRERVLSAYRSRCAFCGVQLKLVDAAHIVPVKHGESNDEISNGLCLCALHHRAFDQGLVALLPDYQIAINRTKLALLQSQNLSDGKDKFVGNLQMRISTPQQRGDRPNTALIRTALRVRELQNDALEPVPSATSE